MYLSLFRDAEMKAKTPKKSQAAAMVSERLRKGIVELQRLHRLLISGEEIEPRILTDFRDSLNRVRNLAWSAQQYLAQKSAGEDPQNLQSILASDRVRVTYQLCQSLQQDLQKKEVRFQPGQLVQLHAAVNELAKSLDIAIQELPGKV
jgi:two-component sensor histidine kinase